MKQDDIIERPQIAVWQMHMSRRVGGLRNRTKRGAVLIQWHEDGSVEIIDLTAPKPEKLRRAKEDSGNGNHT